MSKTDVILQAEGLTYTYEGGDSPALQDLSLSVERGKRIALMGANGSGKSTFLLCCTGICRPQKGKLLFDGKEVSYDRKSLLHLRSKVGLVFQDPDTQLFSASVYQEISFGILNLGIPEEEAAKEVERVMDRLGIAPFRHKPTHALSGGQKKLVSIADILVMHPEVIILDEPAAALDPRHTDMVNRLVDRMTEEGMTVIMATHDVNYAYEWADEVVLFHEGRVLAQGTPSEVFRDREALERTHLERPVVLKLFEDLCSQGVLDAGLPYPAAMTVLEEYLVRRICSSPECSGGS